MVAGRRGVSAVLVELILVSIALAMSISFIGYVMGWFSFSTSSTQSIRVYPDSYIELNYQDNTVCVHLHVYVNYKPYVIVNEILLHNTRQSSVEVLGLEQGNATVNGTKIILYDGMKGWIKACYGDLTPDKVPEDYPGRIEVNIVTSEGFLMKGAVKIEEVS